MHPRTIGHIAAVRERYGAQLASMSDDAIAKIVAWTSDRTKAVTKAAVLLRGTAPAPTPAPVVSTKPVIANVSNDDTIRAEYRVKPAPSPHAPPGLVEEFSMVEIWLDDPAIGCGYRRLIVVSRDDRIVKLLCPSTLNLVNVDRKLFEKRSKPARKVCRSTIGEIIRKRRDLADRVNGRAQKEILPDGREYVVRVLQLLGA